MRSEDEIRERIKEIMERLRYNYTNHNLSVFLENKLIHEHNTLKWVLQEDK